MRDWDPAIPVSLLILIFLFWAINWLAHHISLRWRRYLRYLLWMLFVGVIIAVPELRAMFEDLVHGVLSLESATLIVLSLVSLIAWAVLDLSQPAQHINS
jgi:hypothetical protein